MEKKIWITPLNLEELNRRCKDSLSSHLGIEFIDFGSDFLTARMTIDKRTIQPMGIMHGGASAALAETVGSAAGNYCVDQTKFVCVGIDLNINHLRPIQSGHVDGIAKPLHLGSRTQVWEIKVYDCDRKLISAARLTLMITEKRSLR